MKHLDFLDQAGALEDAMAESYDLLAGLAADAEISEAFKKLRREEENHARVIRAGKNYLRRAPDLFGEAVIGADELMEGLAATRAVLEDIRAERLDLREAVVCIRRLEAQFEKIHMDTALGLKDEDLRKLFRQMASDDRDHRDVLDDIFRRLG